VHADLFVDASGFRSELLGRALEVPYQSFAPSLFTDRAVIGGFARSTEVIKPYTVAETMNHGWAWQIEHAHFINRGYVYSSAHCDDETARAELLQKNPSIPPDSTRVVKYRSGRRAKNWVGNVVGVGNAVGFVEPLEATALGIIAQECVMLADSLAETGGHPGPVLVDVYNQHNTQAWDEIRDFLAVHYAFNTRLDTPFWRDCRDHTQLAGATKVVDWFRENGPSTLVQGILIPETNSFGFEGYLAMLVGQRVHYPRERKPTPKETQAWRQRLTQLQQEATGAMTVAEALRALKLAGWLK
jgi:tryptophan halogenase